MTEGVKDMKLSMEAIRVQLKMTRKEMAEAMEISIDRYNRLAAGETKMLATELVRLHNISNLPYRSIEVIS